MRILFRFPFARRAATFLRFIMKSLKATILTEMKLAVKDVRLSDCDMLEEAVHSFRRRCKRIRAYLRLLPTSIAKPSRKARQLVRLAGASLSELRDAQVMDRNLRQLHQQLIRTASQGATIDKPIDIHAIKRPSTLSHHSSVEEHLISAGQLLKKAIRVVSRMPDVPCNHEILVNLRKTYEEGRLATQTIVKKPCPEAFHELRKMTKQIYHQAQFVKSAMNCKLQTEIDNARVLADKLGDALDLSVLSSNLANAPQDGDESKIAAIIDESHWQMMQLFDASALLAHRLYFDSPKEFRRRVSR